MKMTIFKRGLCAAMALIISFSLFGCSSKSEDPRQVLENAAEKMKTLDSMSVSADITLDMSASGEGSESMSMSMPMKMTMEMANMKSDLSYHMLMDATFLGMNISSEQTYYNGTLYSTINDEKTKMSMPMSDASSYTSVGQVGNDFKNMKAEKSNDSIIVTIEPTEDELTKIMESLGSVGESSSLDPDMLATLSSLKFDAFKIIVNADGYIESEEFGFSAESEGVQVVFSVKMNMSGFNSTTVEKVNEEDYAG